METTSYVIRSQKLAVGAALMVSLVLIGAFFSVQTADGSSGQPAAIRNDVSSAPVAAQKAPATKAPVILGSAFLDLNQLADQNSIDESDNARWSLVRGTPAESQVYSSDNGVNWEDLRQVTASGAYPLPAGATWSFNDTFANGPGYKIASGVLAGGHCALATVFRAAAIHADLPTQAIPHRYPIPGFPLNQTVTIWWGQYDLTIKNTTSLAIDLAWSLTPEGIEISILQVQ